ncbi:bacterial Ig-like domain-containing protein [Lactococcus fujiensis]|uniref:bacterial Ig-like domain-containing protein n=1 Tax=Lactococcus fujiensis TaxID=610251 RepID=UPI0006D0A800|nr:bacterial Ig-like domain-containing protein [Lactococcus fujiensis]
MKKNSKAILIMGLACLISSPLVARNTLADQLTGSSSKLAEVASPQSSASVSSSSTSTSNPTGTTDTTTTQTNPDSTVSGTNNPATSIDQVPTAPSVSTPTTDLTTLEVKDVTLTQNSQFQNALGFISATDSTGANLSIEGVTVTGTVETSKVGTYNLIYTNGTISKSVTVTVKADLSSLNVKNITVTQNSVFKNDFAFVSATDQNGNSLTLANLNVTGTVDTNKIGTYTLTFSNGNVVKTATVTVTADLTSLNVKNVSLMQNSVFKNEAAFISATDVSGNALPLSALNITGTVNSAKVGTYNITFTNGAISKTITVTVTPIPVKEIAVYRMYNPLSGEHFYTQSYNERSVLVGIQWNCEGTGWYAPDSGNAVYRLYNNVTGEHFFTLSAYEKNVLVTRGWKYEGISLFRWERKNIPRLQFWNKKTQFHNIT